MRADPLQGTGDRAEAGRLERTGGFDAGQVLREIAKPRLTGSEGAAEVEATIRARFEAMGYEVHAHAFSFNPWPGRFGITAAGVLYLGGTASAALFLRFGRPLAAVAMLLILLVLAGLVALFAGPVTDALPFARQEGTNLLVQKPGARPHYVVMAHRDSKSQAVPLAFRGPAIILAVLVWLGMLITAAFHTVQPLPGAALLLLTILAVLASVVLILCWVDNRSPGALDNASGVAAALGIAEREAAAGDVAFLITDAEELGLVGARAAARYLPPVAGVINMDGLDDQGPFYVFERFGLVRRRGLAPHLAVALMQEAAERGEELNRRDLPFGIPVDHIPIVKAGFPAVTLMRGSFSSLQRVHRPSDDLASLRGDGVVRAVDLVSGALARLRQQDRALGR
jgi:hypothetical protein